MRRIQQLPDIEPYRIATGPARFGTDWPGIFIRGDGSIGYANCIRAVLDFTKRNMKNCRSAVEIAEKEYPALIELQELLKLLNAANLTKRNSRKRTNASSAQRPVMPPEAAS